MTVSLLCPSFLALEPLKACLEASLGSLEGDLFFVFFALALLFLLLVVSLVPPVLGALFVVSSVPPVLVVSLVPPVLVVSSTLLVATPLATVVASAVPVVTLVVFAVLVVTAVLATVGQVLLFLVASAAIPFAVFLAPQVVDNVASTLAPPD